MKSPIDFKGTEWSLMLALHYGMAYTKDNKISKITLEGIHGTRLKGKCSHRAPKGYKNVRKNKHSTHVNVDIEIAPIIQSIFYKVAFSPLTPSVVCKKFNKQYKLHINKNALMYMLRNVFNDTSRQVDDLMKY